MEEHIADKAWVVQFEKPKGNPAALVPATTVLSPYLKFGCLSIRVFYKRLQQVRCYVYIGNVTGLTLADFVFIILTPA